MPDPASERVDRHHHPEGQHGSDDRQEHVLVGRLERRAVDAPRPRPQHAERPQHQSDQGGHHRVVVIAERTVQDLGEEREADDRPDARTRRGTRCHATVTADSTGPYIPSITRMNEPLIPGKDHGADGNRAGDEVGPGLRIGDLGRGLARRVLPQPEEYEDRQPSRRR